jgi:hypothetical protein
MVASTATVPGCEHAPGCSKLELMNIRMVLATSLVIVGSVASADPGGDAELERALKHPAPGPGLERAPVAPPGWCGRITDPDRGWPYTLVNELRGFESSEIHSPTYLVSAARTVCNEPRSPLAQRAAAEILQDWINASGESVADATTSLAARFDDKAFEAAHESLCKALDNRSGDDSDDDDDSNPRALADARRHLLGCLGTEQWRSPGTDIGDLLAYAERGSLKREPLAYAAWVLSRTAKALDPSERPERVLLNYIIDQFDLHGVTPDDVRRVADTAPFQGNHYARAVLLESAGALGLAIARYESAVTAKSADPNWRELLVTAPQRGAAAWQAAASKYKDALAHSDAFAAAFSRVHFGSYEGRGGGKHPGCEKQLEADFQAIARRLPHQDTNAFVTAVSDDPLAGLLLSRLVDCRIVDGDEYAANVLTELLSAVRVMPGPRTAAYYAVIDSGAPQRAHVQLTSLPSPTRRASEHQRGELRSGDDGGVIASVSRTAKGVHVTFVKKHIRYMSQTCVETSKPDRITSDGKIIYRTECHDAGMKNGTSGADPVDLPERFAGALRPGRYAAFSMQLGRGAPLSVWADANRKRLVAVAGIVLE